MKQTESSSVDSAAAQSPPKNTTQCHHRRLNQVTEHKQFNIKYFFREHDVWVLLWDGFSLWVTLLCNSAIKTLLLNHQEKNGEKDLKLASRVCHIVSQRRAALFLHLAGSLMHWWCHSTWQQRKVCAHFCPLCRETEQIHRLFHRQIDLHLHHHSSTPASFAI